MRVASLLLGWLVVASGMQQAVGADPVPVPFEAVEDVVFGHKDGLALTMDVLTPKENVKGIGVLLISSGGWRSGKSENAKQEARRRDREHWVQGLLGGGYTLFIVRHGSIPRYHVPEMIEDVRRSVRFVRMNADKFGVDPDRLVITSGSSGGHLALMVGLTGDDGDEQSEDPVERSSSRVKAIVSWFAPTDLVNFGVPQGFRVIALAQPHFLEEVFGKVEDPVAQLRAISPIEFISDDDPPVLLIHGDADLTVPLQQSRVFEAKYREAGRDVKLIVEPGGKHTEWPGIMDRYPEVWEWMDDRLAGNASAGASAGDESSRSGAGSRNE